MRTVFLFFLLMTSIAGWAQGKGVFTTDKSKLIAALTT